ncbi:MAG: hypothetical protein M3Y34_00710 [Actinomycetota bacterium]|nr:hypothetical protein [Actinomycetota bacterium]
MSAPGRPETRLGGLRPRVAALVRAIEDSDPSRIEEALLRLSESRFIFRPLAFAIGAFALLLDGLKLLVTNWRLLAIQILPAMWIWAAMGALRAHVLYDDEFEKLSSVELLPVELAVVSITVACFFLNAVFAFAILRPGAPIRPAVADARSAWRPIVVSGAVVGTLLAIAATEATRWEDPWYSVALGAVIGLMMVAYIAVPSRIIGLKPTHSRRDRMMTTIVSGALGVTIAVPPYLLGRLGLLMLGSPVLRIPGVALLVAGFTLEAGATSAVRAIKMSGRLRPAAASRSGSVVGRDRAHVQPEHDDP